MKRLIIFLIVPLLVFACSYADIPLLPQPIATETLIPSNTPLPTNTPQPPIPPTYTSTPTLIGAAATFTPIDAGTQTALFIATYTATPTMTSPAPASSASPDLSGTGFDSVALSTDQFYSGSCEPGTATVTAQVSDPSTVLSVVLFVRFRNKSSGILTGWDHGSSMDSQGGGAFTYTLNGSKMGMYADVWVEYQLIGTDSKAQNVARSPVFSDSLSLSPCP